MPLMFWQGKPLIVGGKLAMHERCCCGDDAPCTCPDGLDSLTVSVSYHLKITDGSTVVVDEDRSRTLTAMGDPFGCSWEGPPFDSEYAVAYSGIGLIDCAWNLAPGFPCGMAVKSAGSSPVGSYPDIDCLYGPVRFEITNIIITEVP